jgi:hypothetical protein
MIAGYGFAAMAWQEAQRLTYAVGPRERPASRYAASNYLCGGPSSEYYRILDRAAACFASREFMPAGHCLRVTL